jgi:hypothetical protein
MADAPIQCPHCGAEMVEEPGQVPLEACPFCGGALPRSGMARLREGAEAALGIPREAGEGEAEREPGPGPQADVERGADSQAVTEPYSEPAEEAGPTELIGTDEVSAEASAAGLVVPADETAPTERIDMAEELGPEPEAEAAAVAGATSTPPVMPELSVLYPAEEAPSEVEVSLREEPTRHEEEEPPAKRRARKRRPPLVQFREQIEEEPAGFARTRLSVALAWLSAVVCFGGLACGLTAAGARLAVVVAETTLAVSLLPVPLALLLGVAAIYLLRGFGVTWLAARVFALCGMMLGLMLIFVPVAGTAAGRAAGESGAGGLWGLWAALAGLGVVLLFAQAWAGKLWARRCAGVGMALLCALAAMRLARGGTVAGLRLEAGVFQVAELWRLIPFWAGAVAFGSAVAVGIPGPEADYRPAESRVLRRNIARILAGLGVVGMVVALILARGALERPEWVRSALAISGLAVGGLIGLYVVVAVVAAWAREVSLEYDILTAVHFSWPVVALVACVAGGSLLVAVAGAAGRAWTGPGLAVCVGAGLLVVCAYLGRQGVKWPIHLLAPLAVVLALRLVAEPGALLVPVEAALTGLPAGLAGGLALAGWAVTVGLVGYVAAGLVYEALRARAAGTSRGGAALVLLLGLGLPMAVLALGLAEAAGTEAVRRWTDLAATGLAKQAERLLLLVAGPVIGGAVSEGVAWVFRAALGLTHPGFTAGLYGLAVVGLVLHLLASKGARLSLHAVSIVWLLTGMAVLLAAVGFAARLLVYDDLMNVALTGWAAAVGDSRTLRLLLVALLAAVGVCLMRSSSACTELVAGLGGPEAAEAEAELPGDPGREIYHLRALGLVLGVVGWVLALMVNPAPGFGEALDEVARVGVMGAGVLGDVASGTLDLFGVGWPFALAGVLGLYLLLGLNVATLRARVSAFPWLAGFWTVVAACGGYGLVLHFGSGNLVGAGRIGAAVLLGLVWLLLVAATIRLWLCWVRLVTTTWWREGPRDLQFELRPARRSGWLPGALGAFGVGTVLVLVAVLGGRSLGRGAGAVAFVGGAVDAMVTEARAWTGELRAGGQGGLWSALLAFGGTALVGLHVMVARAGRGYRFVVAGLWGVVILGAAAAAGYGWALRGGAPLGPESLALALAGLYGFVAVASATVSTWAELFARGARRVQ